jgi:hypothetical protein
MNLVEFVRNTDRLFAVLMIVISLVLYGLIGGLEEPYSPGAMAASTYPRLILGCIMSISCLVIIRPVHGQDKGEKFSLQGVAVIVFLAIYIALLETLGFFLLTPVCLFILPLMAGFRRYSLILLSVIIITAALYGVFVEVLNIPLPQGLLGE